MSNPFATHLRAYHDDPTVKWHYLYRVRAHAADDEIIQGVYWERGRGCAVGCTIHGADHTAYERELGIPRILAHLEDRLFERMALADAKPWPERFLAAIPVGADLSLVWPQFAHWLLVDPTNGVLRYATTERIAKTIRDVAALYEALLSGEGVSRVEWNVARNAAAAAYEYAAAAEAATEAAVSAAAAAADAAEAATEAYKYAAAAEAATAAAAVISAAYTAAQRTPFAALAGHKLLELLERAPVSPLTMEEE